jgi:hypothetical protein
VNPFLERLKPNQRRGSKPRCHELLHCGADRSAVRDQISRVLAQSPTPLSVQFGLDDYWLPNGFKLGELGEAELHKAPHLTSAKVADALGSWWLAAARRASRTPTWDIACLCRIDGRRGILLVEAKAHHRELEEAEAGKPLDVRPSTNSCRNHARIGACIEEANCVLTTTTRRTWALSRDHHYQMSNRFAWSWKLAELGIPVVLVYLGFLKCDDLKNGEKAFDSARDWEKAVLAHSAPLFPADIWNSEEWKPHGQPLIPLIRSMTLQLPA